MAATIGLVADGFSSALLNIACLTGPLVRTDDARGVKIAGVAMAAAFPWRFLSPQSVFRCRPVQAENSPYHTSAARCDGTQSATSTEHQAAAQERK
jgi:hypothetical protein